jgi:two-component system, LytTR family, response regulator
MQTKIIIVDDEKDAVDSLELMLNEYCSDITIVGKAFSVIEAIKEIQNKKPDIVFLDIEMPHGTGFDILDSIPERKFSVIFTTAYNDYAIKAIKASAIDYLLKPIDIDELIGAVEKAREQIQKSLFPPLIKEIPASQAISALHKKITVISNSSIEFINMDEIIRIEGAGSYSIIFLINDKKIIASKHLKEFQNILPEEIFCRVHNSHIINLHLVKRFLRNDGVIEMNDGSLITLSRRNKDEFILQMDKLTQ